MNCRMCGHEEQVHQHYREGTDCGICGRDKCPRFKGDRSRIVYWFIRRFLRRN